jgi:hypothetical protein
MLQADVQSLTHAFHLIFHSALERERTITSIPLAEELAILKQINIVKKSKLQIDECNAIEKQIQEKRVRREN